MSDPLPVHVAIMSPAIFAANWCQSMTSTPARSILPAASISTDAAIAVCFAPEEDCAAFAVRAIDNAESEILVSAYRLTVGSGVAGALIRAKERGVHVRVIADRTAPCGRASGIDRTGLFPGGRWIRTSGSACDASAA